MRSSFARLLSLLLAISYTLSVYAGNPQVDKYGQKLGFQNMRLNHPNRPTMQSIGEKDMTPVEKKLGLYAILDYEAPVEHQTPDQFFADDAPKSFTDAPKRFFNLKGITSKIIAEQKVRDAHPDAKHRITVSIIDSGMDVLNNFARKIVDWKIEGGKITGMGNDHLAENSWGIPQLRDPWIYAMGADGINEAFQIVKPIEKPIAYLNDLNDAIMAEVTDTVKNDPNLKNTFFAKINSANTNMIGLLRLLSYEANTEGIEQLAKLGRVLSPSSDPSKLKGTDVSLFKYASTAYLMSAESGLPDFFSNFDLEKLKGLTDFQEVIKKIVLSENAAGNGQKLLKLISNQVSYFAGHHFQSGVSENILQAYTFGKISQQIAFKKLGTPIFSPTYKFYLSLRKLKANNPNDTWEQLIEKGLTVHANTISEMMSDTVTRTNIAEMGALNGQLRGLKMVRQFILDPNSTKSIDATLKQIEETGRMPWIKGESSLVRKYVMRTSMPGFHPTATEMHGTHVGTTGEAYLGTNYTARPSRVGLGYIKGNPIIIQRLVQQNVQVMYEWFQIPVVSRAIFDVISKDGVAKDPNFASEIPPDVSTPANRTKLAQFMANMMAPTLASTDATVGLDLHFKLIEQFKQNAQDKIMFGNLSLGGEYAFPSRHATIDDPAEKLGSKLEYIFGEFQRYVIAQSLLTDGKYTTYFMAAGNSNNIGDGTTQVDYPADLRPKWLEKYKAKDGRDGVLPGENMPNLVVVMSANEDGNRSSFSNMIFTNNKQYMMTGENILSGTTGMGLEMAKTIIQARVPEVNSFKRFVGGIDPDDPRLSRALKNMNNMPYSFYSTIIDNVLEAAEMTKLNLALAHNDQKHEISGTSMATPGEEELTKSRATERLKKANLTAAEAYGQPGFLPADHIADLDSIGTLVEIGNSKNTVRSHTAYQKRLEHSNLSKVLTNTLNDTRRNAECRMYYSMPPVKRRVMR